MNQGRQANQFGRSAKVEFPKFQRDDVRGWVFKCDQFFIIDNTPNDEKVKIVSVHLSDKALLWHRQYLTVIRENVGWEVYKNAIIQRFGSIFEDPMYALKNVKYEKNAREYQDLFNTLLCRVTISQEHVINAYSLTILQEAILDAVKKKNNPSGPSNRNMFDNGAYYGNASKPAILSKPNTPVNAPYTQGHKCACQLFSLVLVPDEEDRFEDYLNDEIENMTSIGIKELQPQISLNALTGTNNFQTIRWLATLGDIKCKFKELRMEFKYGGKKVKLKGTHKSNVEWMNGKQIKNSAR
ncbi:retrotransposable element Tf2 [Tanacetum coccineum]